MRSASRQLPDGGREEAGYLPASPDVFGFLHLPEPPARAGVVVCSAIHAEMGVNYRREVLLSRRLAAAGVAVQRFCYCGTGHSGGNAEQLDLVAMVDDAAAALDALRRATNTDRIAVVGTRLGAVVAAATAREHMLAAATLWDPVEDARQHLRMVLRAGLIRDLKDGGDGRARSGLSAQQLRAAGSCDILGYSVTQRLYDSLEGRGVASELGGAQLPIHVVAFSAAPQPGIARLVSALTTAGHRVRHDAVELDQAWWFGGSGIGDGEAKQEATDALVSLTARELMSALGVGESRVPA